MASQRLTNLGARLPRLRPAQWLAVGGIAAGVAAALALLVWRLATPSMGVLFAGLDPQAGGAVIQRLEALAVPYDASGESTIRVPEAQVARLRMLLAGEGLPSSQPSGYELLDAGQGFGLTRFQEDLRYVRALEGELARTIQSLDGVAAARVHLVLPKREPFSRAAPTPTASILVHLRGLGRLGAQQVAAIQHLVAGAVPQLAPDAVAVVDQQGHLLAQNGDDQPAAARANEARQAYEARLEQAVSAVLEPHVGAGKVRVTVHADLDFDRRTLREESFDPDGQVTRSTQTTSETQSSSDGQAGGAVGVSRNLPQGGGSGGQGGTSSSASSRKEETVNYEISSRRLETVSEGGVVRKLSVAVMVDGTTAPDAQGRPAYVPRPAEELAGLERAIKAAVGFDAQRGDTVELVNLPFEAGEAAAEPAPEGVADLLRRNVMTLAQWATLALVAALLVLFVLRPLVGHLLAPPVAGAAEAEPASLAAAEAPPQLAGPATPVQRVAELAAEQPEAAADVLRRWIQGTPA